MTEQSFSKRKFQRRVFGSIAVLTLWAILFSALLLTVVNDMYAFFKKDLAIEIEIEEALHPRELARLLADRGVIANPTVFSFYLEKKLSPSLLPLPPMTLSLNADMSYREILLEIKEKSRKIQSIAE